MSSPGTVTELSSSSSIQNQLAFLWNPLVVRALFYDVLTLTPLVTISTSMIEQSPSKVDRLKQSTKHQLEKLNIKPGGVVGNFIQAGFKCHQETSLLGCVSKWHSAVEFSVRAYR